MTREHITGVALALPALRLLKERPGGMPDVQAMTRPTTDEERLVTKKTFWVIEAKSAREPLILIGSHREGWAWLRCRMRPDLIDELYPWTNPKGYWS